MILRPLVPALFVAFALAACSSTTTTASTTTSLAAATTAVTAATTVVPTTAATTVAPTTALPTTTTAAPPAWAAVAPGKFSVGVATLVLDDPAGVRPLTVDVWFPLSDKADKATFSPEQYTLLPGVYYQSPTALAAKVDQISSETFPLVVYSHGSGGLR